MGHCFRRTGATGTGGIDADPTEQEFAQACCYRASVELRAAGHEPTIIDADEPDAAYAGFDAFFAVHCDGSTSPAARGASVGYRTPEGAHLGAAWKQAYHEAGWAGFRPDNYTAALAGYYGVREAVDQGCRYSVIVEAGFLTSPHDEPLLSLPDGPERAARAITDAVVAVFGGSTPVPPEDDLPYTEQQLHEIVKRAVRVLMFDEADTWRAELRRIVREEAGMALPVPNYVLDETGTTTFPLPTMVGYGHHAGYFAAHYAGAPGFDLAAPADPPES